jgi:hypothetical protein
LIISPNFLSPAELFKPFTRFTEHYFSGDNRSIPIKCPPLRFLDIQEKNRFREDRFRSELTDIIDSNKPNCEYIKSLNIDWNSPTSLRNMLKLHSWPTFNLTWKKALETAVAEEVEQIHSRCMILLTIVSADEPDIGQAINEVTNQNEKELRKLFDTDRYGLDKKIMRLNLILDDSRVDNKLTEDFRAELSRQARHLYPKSFTRIVTTNRGSPKNKSDILWENFVYKKYKITHFEISEFEKVKVDSPGLVKGELLSQEDVDDVRKFLESAVKVYLLKKMETKFIEYNAEAMEKKKKIKRGFFGLFKKEEKAVMIDGRYMFTDIEQSVKYAADLAFVLGNYDFALKEYKVLYDEIKVKSQ